MKGLMNMVNRTKGGVKDLEDASAFKAAVEWQNDERLVAARFQKARIEDELRNVTARRAQRLEDVRQADEALTQLIKARAVTGAISQADIDELTARRAAAQREFVAADELQAQKRRVLTGLNAAIEQLEATLQVRARKAVIEACTPIARRYAATLRAAIALSKQLDDLVDLTTHLDHFRSFGPLARFEVDAMHGGGELYDYLKKLDWSIEAYEVVG